MVAAICATVMLAAAVAVLAGSPAGAQANPFWGQLGQDIDGESALDGSGEAVAMSADGNTVIISAPFNAGSGTNSGHARIYNFDGTSWTQLGQDIDGEAAFDFSGRAVAISADGNTVAIGAALNDGNGSFSGHARIYSFNGTSWTQVGGDIDGENASDQSGSAVAISADGNTVIIGAPGNDGNGSNSGHARIYSFNGTSWTQVGADIDGEAAFDNSGEAVAISADGNTVIIGASGNDGNGSFSGHARIYRFDGTSWTQVGADIDGENAGDGSGFSVAMSADGDTVAIGAPGNGGNGSFSGHARIYSFDGTSWTQVGQDIDGEAAGDFSGDAVAMSADGNTVAIGAPGNGGNGSFSGHARIYSFDGTSWTQLGQDIDGENAFDGGDDGQRRAVAISADGNTVAFGASDNDGNGTNSGHARVFRGQNPALCNNLPVTLYAALGLPSTTGNDVILGTAGADVILGLAGDDTICGLGGDDTINGGPGNDTVFAGDGNDTVFGLDGNDSLSGENGDDVVLGGNGNDLIDGADGNDVLNGGAGNDSISGGAGDDRIFGQGGSDTLNGGDGRDLVVGADGIDTVDGGAGNDTVNGGAGNDTVNGDAGNDTVFGFGGDDVVTGGDGNDLVFGQLGNDTVFGDAGDDQVLGNEGNDLLSDSSGTNILNGGDGDDQVTGGTGNDRIFGDGNVTHAGDDTLDGGLGVDVIVGFAGADTITANDGIADTVNGGPGVDSCTTDGIDTVFNCP